MLVEHYRAMARNNAWSNLRLHRACGRLSEAEYKAERTSFFPSIHLTLNHILIVDLLYLEGLEWQAEAYRDPGDELHGDLPALTPGKRRQDRPGRGGPAAPFRASDPPPRPSPRHARGHRGHPAPARRVLPGRRRATAASGTRGLEAR